MWLGAIGGACLLLVWFAGRVHELRWTVPGEIEVSVDRGTFRINNAVPGPNLAAAGWDFFRPNSKRQYFPSTLIDGTTSRISLPLWIPGVLGIAGKMFDRPHLRRAERLLARAGRIR